VLKLNIFTYACKRLQTIRWYINLVSERSGKGWVIVSGLPLFSSTKPVPLLCTLEYLLRGVDSLHGRTRIDRTTRNNRHCLRRLSMIVGIDSGNTFCFGWMPSVPKDCSSAYPGPSSDRPAFHIRRSSVRSPASANLHLCIRHVPEMAPCIDRRRHSSDSDLRTTPSI
jgi:hypothetical protein